MSLVLEPHRQSAWRIQTQVGGELPVTVTAVGGVTDGGSASGASEVAVQVTDASGNPVPDILVGFQLDEGSATLAPAVASTNQKGIATTAVATRSSERIVVRATASALVGEPVTFTITPGAVARGEASKSGVAPAPMRAGDH